MQAGERRNAENLSESSPTAFSETMPRSSVGCRNTWPPGWLTPSWTAPTLAVGVARQYCLGWPDTRRGWPTVSWDGDNCISGPGRVSATGIRELAFQRALGLGHPRPDGLPGDAFGISPFLAGLGMRTCRSGQHSVWPGVAWTSPGTTARLGVEASMPDKAR